MLDISPAGLQPALQNTQRNKNLTSKQHPTTQLQKRSTAKGMNV
jgi:hypothetical protein